MARTTSQFRHFFPAWSGYLHGIIENNCTELGNDYYDVSNESRLLPYELANCILDNMAEFRKTEMSITAVILGLLPTILQQVGPTVAEVSVLATRRPLLAFLLGIAMPSVSTSGSVNPAETLRSPVDVHIYSGALARAQWLWWSISAAEYLIALAAITNVFHQLYQLAYWSISISSIAVYNGGISQTYAPFLWVILLVPAHLIGFWGFKLRYRTSRRARDGKTWIQAIKSEFSPCVMGEPLLLKEVKKGLLFIVVRYFTDMASLAVFIFGTVALSSQIFISLGDVIPVIGRFLLSTLVCRLILLFELHGLREATSRLEKTDDVQLLGGGYTPVFGQDGTGSAVTRVPGHETT
jgi:hypothetical protein